MALTRTNLTAPIGASDIVIPVASTAVGFPPIGLLGANHQLMLIDNEAMWIWNVPVANQVVVRSRGSDGTQAVAHDVRAPVITSSQMSDFPPVPPGQLVMHNTLTPDQLTYGQSQVILTPIKNTQILMTAGAAITLTLLAPSLASNGIQVSFSSTTAQAHVISSPLLLNTGVAGSPFSTATFPAQLGVSLTLEAANGFWNVLETNGAIVFA